MLVEFRSAGAAADLLDFRDLHDQPLGDQADTMALRKRDPRIEEHIDGQRALVEGRQEGAWQLGREHDGGNDTCQNSRHQDLRVAEGPVQKSPVRLFQHADDDALVLVEALEARQQVVGHDGREGDRDNERCQDRDDIGLAEGSKQPAFDPGQGEQRYEDENDDHRGIDDAGTDFLARGNHDRKDGARIGFLPVLPKTTEDVLDIDDRVVDQFADRDRQSSKGHRVDRQPEQMEDNCRDENGDGDGCQRDCGGARVQKEREQDDGDHDDRFRQDLLDVADRGFDKVGLPEKHLVGFHAFGQGRADLAECRFNFAGELDRVDVRLLLHRDDHGGLTLITGIASLQAGSKGDVRDLAQQDRLTLDRRHHDTCQILDILRAAHVADQELAAVLVGEAPARVRSELGKRLLDLFEGDAECTHGGRIRRNPVLPNLAADRDDLGNAGNAQDSRADREIRQLPQFHRRDTFRTRHGDQHDLAHDRVYRPHLRNDIGGKLRLDEGKTLRDLLAIAVDLGIPVELHIDDRQADAGCRADAAHTRQAVHLGLERIGHKLLDLLRRKAFGFRHDGDGGPVEVRENVDRQVGHGERAVNHQNGGNGQHE